MNTKSRKKKYIIGAIVIFVLVIGGFFALRNGNGDVVRISVEQKDIVQTVLAAGNTKAIDNVELGFETSGRVQKAYVDVGDEVKAGQILVELDTTELQADLLKAKAELAEENAVVTTDNIAIADAVQSAKIVIADAYIKADNAVRENIDQFFENPGGGVNTSFEPQIEDGASGINFSVSFNDRVSINTKRAKVQKELDAWDVEIASMTTNNVEAVLASSQQHLLFIKDLVDEVSTVVFTFESPDTENISTVAGFKTDVSNARTNITTALSNIVSAQEKINNAKVGVVASGISGAVSAQDARKLQLQAQIKNIEAQIAKRKIYASFDGVVTQQDVEQGEIVTAGTTIVSVISNNKLEIESNISEVNIGKIVVGNPVEITLDAFPGEVFTGMVAYIDPAETIVDGVVNYKVKVAIASTDSRIKSGLTANLNIETARKTQTTAIPLYAVSTRAEGTFVKKVSGEEVSETPVTLGVVGRDGMVEILSGLSVGDEIEVAQRSTQ